MSVTKDLYNYIKLQFDSESALRKYLESSPFCSLMSDFTDLNHTNLIPYKINKFLCKNHIILLTEINNIFLEAKIKFLIFKGLSISSQLYSDLNKRFVGDIDIYVYNDNFYKAVELLGQKGYSLESLDTIMNKHHLVFIKENVTIELHKSFINPEVMIDEKYLRCHTTECEIDNFSVRTFDKTATLLHLFYHLYMDTNGAYKSLYSLFENGSLPKADRFLYRAYEIALFSEKYRNAVKWEDIINDLKKQPLRIFFKQMIFDIDEIFNGALPDFFIKAVNELDYKENITDELSIKPFINSKSGLNEEYRQKILCRYIKEMRLLLNDKGKSLSIGEENSIKSSDKNSRLSCNMKTEKCADGIKLVFEISDNDILMSPADEYNTASSDGVHLVLFNPAPYFYKSIFFFPKRGNDGKIYVKVCDVLSEPYLLKQDIISADFGLTDDGYVITALLTSEFLKSGNIENEVYFNYMISDCDAHTRQRIETLLPMDSVENWYDPSYFIKLTL